MRRAGYIVALKSNPDLQSKKAGPNALPFLSSLSAKSHLDEMNSHVTVGAARGVNRDRVNVSDNSNAFGRILFPLSRKARLSRRFGPETINMIISIDNLTPVSYPRDDNKQ